MQHCRWWPRLEKCGEIPLAGSWYSVDGSVFTCLKILGNIQRIFAGLLACALSSCGGNIGTAASAGDAPIRGLPADAVNISYALGGPNRLYEFDTAEANFRSWVAAEKRPMGPIEQTSAAILRCDVAAKEFELLQIPEALVARWTGSQADEGQHMVYDLQKGRAYYWRHSR